MITCCEAIDLIKSHVADRYGVTVADIDSYSRKVVDTHARQTAQFIARELTDLSSPAIAEHFGRDHTTILHAIETVRVRISSRTQFRRPVAELIASLRPIIGPEIDSTPCARERRFYRVEAKRLPPSMEKRVKTCRRCGEEYVSVSDVRICGACRSHIKKRAA